MATVRFKGYGDVNVRAGEKGGATILEAAQTLGAPEGSECGGCCSCSTCHVYVISGMELLSPKEDDELDILDLASDVRTTSRLGCQAKLVRDGVVEVEISKESYETFVSMNGPPKIGR